MSESATSATTVVYVAGYGRSGSTLLDLLLGRLDGWSSMGEFRLFWHAWRDAWRCACGREVGACPVWTEVLTRADVSDPAGIIADLRTTVRWRRVPGLLDPRLLGRHRAAHARVVAHLAHVYRAAAEVNGARVLVDSSKDPIYGLLLRGVPGIRVHVVHLVRDSRAVAYSWQRTRVRPEIGDATAYMPVRSPSQTSIEWDLKNALTHVLARRADGSTLITYESLVADHERVVADLARAVAGRDQPRAARAPGGANHTVAGNPMRFDAGELQVTPDVEWRDALDANDRRLVTALTWPWLWRYGYR
jgi:hypothetical protein